MATIRPWPRFAILSDHHNRLPPDSPEISIVSTWSFAKLHTYIHSNFPDDLLPPNIYPTSVFRALHLSPSSPTPSSHPITAAWLAAKPHILSWAAASHTAHHWHDVITSTPIKIPGIGSPSELAAHHAPTTMPSRPGCTSSGPSSISTGSCPRARLPRRSGATSSSPASARRTSTRGAATFLPASRCLRLRAAWMLCSAPSRCSTPPARRTSTPACREPRS